MILKTPVRTGLTDCGVCNRHLPWESGFKPDYVRRNHFLPSSASLYARVPCRGHYLGLHHLSCICGRDHRRHIGPGFRRFKPRNHGKGNIRLPGLRRLRIRPFHCIRMSACNLILPECGPGGQRWSTVSQS